MYRPLLCVLLTLLALNAFAQRQWLPTSNTDSTIISDFQPTTNGLLIATFGNGIQKTSDLGATWRSIEIGLDGNPFFSDFSAVGDWLYVSARRVFPNQSGGIYKSSDQGETWQIASDSLLHKDVYALTRVGNRLFAGTYLGIYVSDNQGNSWTKIDLAHDEYGSDWILSMASTGNTIIAGSNDGRIFTSTDQGNTWTVNHLLKEGISITQAYVFDDVFYVSATGTGVYQSADGLEWEEVELGLSEDRKNMSTYLKIGDDQYYSSAGNIYRNGNLFQEGFNLNFPAARSFVIYQNTLFAGTFHQGVWKYDSPANNNVVDHLLTVHPNPTSAATILQLTYEVLTADKVHILLVDQNGQPLRTIVDTHVSEGTHQVEVDISGLHDGNYYFYYRMNDQQLTRNFIVTH